MKGMIIIKLFKLIFKFNFYLFLIALLIPIYGCEKINKDISKIEKRKIKLENNGSTNKKKNIIGYSNENFDNYDISNQYEISKLENDPTGKKSFFKTYTENEFLPFALSYKKKHMKPGETHYIVNLCKMTTTKIVDKGEFLDISTFEYNNGEEKNAESIAKGKLLNEYYIFIKDKSIIKADS